MFGLTSEPQSLATEAQENWSINFPSIGDPHHEIRNACQERGFLGIFANKNYGHLRERVWANHPKGYFQPGVLALGSEGRVLYRWRCRPTHSNMSGAGNRPTPEYVWSQIRGALAEGTSDAPIDENPQFAAKDLSWPFFVAILLAHGWFVRPRAFPLGRPGDKPSTGAGKAVSTMKRRLLYFASCWAAAFFVLPVTWVLVGLAAWATAATIGVAELYRQFQQVPVGEPGQS